MTEKKMVERGKLVGRTPAGDEVRAAFTSETESPVDEALLAADAPPPADDATPAREQQKPPIVDPKPPKLSPVDGKAPLKTAEQWAEEKKTPKWLFAATRVGLQWPHGREMTEKDFDAGVAWAAHAPCR